MKTILPERSLVIKPLLDQVTFKIRVPLVKMYKLLIYR